MTGHTAGNRLVSRGELRSLQRPPLGASLGKMRFDQQLLEPSILLLQLLQPLGLIDFQPAVYFAIAVVGLLGDLFNEAPR